MTEAARQDDDASQRRSRPTRRILQDVLDRRPSGMRQRLAEALGKNRSFISQISNPAYPTPIPAQHLALDLRDLPLLRRMSGPRFSRPIRGRIRGRLGADVRDAPRSARSRSLCRTLETPSKNQQLETLIFDFVHRLALLLGEGR